MKIGLNGTCFNDRPSGAKQRFIGIYGELFKRLPEVQFLIYEPLDCQVGGWFTESSNVFAVKTPFKSTGRRQKIMGASYWNGAHIKNECEIFEGFNLPLFRNPSGKTVLTIHDIRGMYSHYGLLDNFLFRKVLNRAIGSADHVVTVSESMKKEILSYYPRTSISVIYNGLDSSVIQNLSEKSIVEFKLKYNLPFEFILSVGHLEDRKNYINLIEAVSLLRDTGNQLFLVIIGNDGGGRELIEEKIKSESLAGRVKVLSGLTDHEVRCAYKLCKLLVFASSYEGFGIPILEAMAANRPMVLSDLPVFREITQNTGFYFQHDDCEAMANAIERVICSENEISRLVDFGKERVQDFNFSKLAEQMENIYRTVQKIS